VRIQEENLLYSGLSKGEFSFTLKEVLGKECLALFSERNLLLNSKRNPLPSPLPLQGGGYEGYLPAFGEGNILSDQSHHNLSPFPFSLFLSSFFPFLPLSFIFLYV